MTFHNIINLKTITIMKKECLTILFAGILNLTLTAQIDSDADQTVKNLYGNLKELTRIPNILFGQEFFNSYSWINGNHEDETFSDCQSVANEHPGVLGQDFHYYIYKDATEMRKHSEAAKYAYSIGCVITFDFHMSGKYGGSYKYSAADKYLIYNIGNNNDSYGEVTWFKNELEKLINIVNNELKFPIVLRLFHEMNGNWFWWGSNAYGGSTSYKKFYQFAVNYIKSRTNYVLFAWSPNYPWTTSYYPGNSYVDIIGLDMYDQGTTSSYPSLTTMVSQLSSMTDYAIANGKIPVFSETGNRVGSPDNYPDWWLKVYNSIQGNSKAKRIAWMLTWINTNWGSYPYIPYLQSSATAKSKFCSFISQPNILMQADAKLRNMYDLSSYKSAEIKQEPVDNESVKLSVYPNPSKDGNFSVNLSFLDGHFVKIVITDRIGRQILNRYNILCDGVYNISMPKMKKGIYLLSISGDYSSFTQKVIIQ
jgi:mannan endo-1,4-beta-mannosidase